MVELEVVIGIDFDYGQQSYSDPKASRVISLVMLPMCRSLVQ